MSDDILRFGIIGSGMIAEYHIKAIAAAKGARAVASYSIGPNAAEFAAQNGLKAYDSLAALLTDPQVNAVTIATPSGLHGEAAIAAAKAGKHVLCEKPIEITPARARAIVDACARNGVILAPVFQSRYGAGASLIREALAAGRFGRVLLVSARIRWLRTQAYYDSADWRGTWEIDGGGCLMNQSIHAIDLMTLFGGVPVEVYGYQATRTHDIPVEDTAVAVVRFQNQVMGVIEASTSCAPGFPLEVSVSGEKGTATLSAGDIGVWNFVDAHPLDAKVGELGPSLGSGGSDPRAISFGGHTAIIEDMIRALNNEPNGLVSGVEACYPVEIICGVYDSARTGKPVKLSFA
ncbi:MAG: Gfo/Idh/MocA family oxidoreductase [Candidatus Accumulibacter sp.]|nr:Gfo/Idh/MocA family oxidoreductase [Accumulibacter sp.]